MTYTKEEIVKICEQAIVRNNNRFLEAKIKLGLGLFLGGMSLYFILHGAENYGIANFERDLIKQLQDMLKEM